MDSWVKSLPLDYVATILAPTFAMLRAYQTHTLALAKTPNQPATRLDEAQLAQQFAFSILQLSDPAMRMERQRVHGRVLSFAFGQHYGGDHTERDPMSDHLSGSSSGFSSGSDSAKTTSP